ncbi:hypothetical protein G7046_g2873 [Stylonectria norvegica]|nr:hypothetical protein G7046_g2873 [Stylonectria norvegica]
MSEATQANIIELLKNDIKVKVAGLDTDGILRGKIMSKEKFLSSVKEGFGFSSAIFGWDMHDTLYTHSKGMSSEGGSYADFTAVPDLTSYRRLPWENNIPFFLLHFLSEGKPVAACPRGMTGALAKRLGRENLKAVAGVELEFINFQTPTEDGYGPESKRPNLAAFLLKNGPKSLRPLTEGMFGYSVTRPVASKDYFHEVFDTSVDFNCHVEGWHTESGPGVFEAALASRDFAEMADRVSLFKLLTKSIAINHHITPCFMAKPLQGLPGSSGHIHVSLTDLAGKNLFAREERNPAAKWPDVEHFSDIGYHFLAGVLDALPDIMPMLAPTVNSYKRFVENMWAPVAITWGNEDRLSSIRLITPPVCKPSAVRMEIRIPGADLHPHYALSAIIGAGLRGIDKKLEITVPPSAARTSADGPPTLLANTLEKALQRFSAPESIAREIFDDDFVDFYTGSRDHELKIWREAVTDWELSRYIETENINDVMFNWFEQWYLFFGLLFVSTRPIQLFVHRKLGTTSSLATLKGFIRHINFFINTPKSKSPSSEYNVEHHIGNSIAHQAAPVPQPDPRQPDSRQPDLRKKLQVRSVRAKRSPEPTRVQPRRAAKVKVLQDHAQTQVIQQKKKRRNDEDFPKATKKQKTSDKGSRSTNIEGGQDEVECSEWETVRCRLLEAIYEEVRRRKETHECVLGPRPLSCSRCIAEMVQEARGHSKSTSWNGDWHYPSGLAPIPEMGFNSETCLITSTEDEGKVLVSEEIRAAGFSFVVDSCRDPIVVMVFKSQNDSIPTKLSAHRQPASILAPHLEVGTSRMRTKPADGTKDAGAGGCQRALTDAYKGAVSYLLLKTKSQWLATVDALVPPAATAAGAALAPAAANKLIFDSSTSHDH